MSVEKLTVTAMFKPDGTGDGWQSLGNVTACTIDNDFQSVTTTRSEKGFRVTNDVQIDGVKFAWLLDTNESFATNETIQRLATVGTASQGAETGGTVNFTGVRQGQYYPIGKVSVSNVTVTGYTAIDDYVIDDDDGLLFIVPDGGIANGSNIEVTYDCPALNFQTFTQNEQVLFQGDFQLFYASQAEPVFRIETFTGIVICVQFADQSGDFSERRFFIVATTDATALDITETDTARVCALGEIVEDWQDYDEGVITTPNGGCGWDGAGVISQNFAGVVATEDYESEPLGTVTTTTGGEGWDGTGAITAN